MKSLGRIGAAAGGFALGAAIWVIVWFAIPDGVYVALAIPPGPGFAIVNGQVVIYNLLNLIGLTTTAVIFPVAGARTAWVASVG